MSAKPNKNAKVNKEKPDTRTPLKLPPLKERLKEVEHTAQIVSGITGQPLAEIKKKLKKAQMEMNQDDWNRAATFSRESELETLIVDPFHEFPHLASILSKFIVGRPDNDGFDIGQLMRKCSSDQLHSLLGSIGKMKEKSENYERTAYAYYAYSNFIKESDREPTKPELKKYIVANRSIYKVAPDVGDGKGWTRLWKSSGLFSLSER
jgi:hypothetical protein